jgi:hypothetical protein
LQGEPLPALGSPQEELGEDTAKQAVAEWIAKPYKLELPE